jgi:hypothetical protein
MSYAPLVYKTNGGDKLVVASGGNITADSGAVVDLSGATLTLPTNLARGFIPIDIFSNRLLSSNAFLNTIEAGTADGNTAPSLARVNGATDKAARIVMAANTTDEIQFHPIPLPPDLDDAAPMTVHLLAGKGTNTDTTNVIDVQAFFGLGDTECGGNTAAMNATAVTEYSVTLAAADVPAHPNVLNISLVPGAHANDAIHIYAAWVEYNRKTA